MRIKFKYQYGLEICDNLWMQNSCKKNEKSSSKYLGVCFRKNTNKWVSSIRYQKKSIHLGYFKTEEEAYEARKKFEQDNDISNKYI